MEKLIITAAICGAEVTREQSPYIPITAEELANEAKRCVDAGASIIHLHVRNDDGTPTQNIEVFRKAINTIKEKCKNNLPIIQPSTGGAVGMTWEERIQPVNLNPEMATLDCGTTNFGNDIFVNDLPLMRKFASFMKERNVMPELECFEIGHIYNALILKKEGLLPEHLHFDFVLGVPGASPASIDILLTMIKQIPQDATWTVAAVGRYQLPFSTYAILLGGNVRVGMEDNIYYTKGVLAKSNAEFVERIVRLAKELGREIATPDEARKILKIQKS